MTKTLAELSEKMRDIDFTMLSTRAANGAIGSNAVAVGADSVARYGTFTDDNPHPQQEPDEAVLFENAQTRIAIKDGRIVTKVAGATMTMMGDKIVTELGASKVTQFAEKILTAIAGSTVTHTAQSIITAIADSIVTHTAEEVEVKSGASTHTVAKTSVRSKSARVKLEAPVTETTGRTELATGGVLV